MSEPTCRICEKPRQARGHHGTNCYRRGYKRLAAENKAVLDALEAVISLAEKFDAEPALAAFLKSKAPQHANILLWEAGRK